MTDNQARIYSEFENSSLRRCEEEIGQLDKQRNEDEVGKSILSLLVSLRKIVNHPVLATKDSKLSRSQELQSYEQSGKFTAMKQLLENLGFESRSTESETASSGPVLQGISGSNKVIVFSRFKETLDLIERSLLEAEFPQIL